MRWKGAIWLFSFLFLLSGNLLFAQEDENRNEVEKLRKEMKEMRESYERRIQKLEGEMNRFRKEEEKGNQTKELEKRVEAVTRKMDDLLSEEAGVEPYSTSFMGTFGSIMNPDISIIVDARYLVTDNKENDNRNKLRLKEAELAFQGYLYPGIRTDIVAALEQEYEGSSVETEIDLEEAFVSFLDLPCGFTGNVGRKFIDFGKLNPIHPHHWPFADMPAPLHNFFGHHNWFDDGGQFTYLFPLPAFLTGTFGIWNGRELGHHHRHEEEKEVLPPFLEHEDATEATLEWDGHVYCGRLYGNLFLDEEESSDLGFGYSIAWDGTKNTTLHGWDLTFRHLWPESYHRLKIQTELFYLDADHLENEHEDLQEESIEEVGSFGAYLLGQYTLNQYWEAGLRYDWSEFANNDKDYIWGVTPFVSYFFTHSTYVRLQYKYLFRDLHEGREDEHAVFIQFVWGLGPHAHRLEE